MARKKKAEQQMNTSAWMNTFADLMNLLLCFFVLLFAMSNIDARKSEAIIKAFQGNTGVLTGGNTIVEQRVVNRGSMSNGQSSKVMEMQNFENLKEEIDEYLKENQLSNQVEVVNEDAGLLLRFQDNVLFDQGSATINPESYQVLDYIGTLLKSETFKDKFVSVEGHTDNVPIKNARFDSNWELSVTRASNVVRYLIERLSINPERLTASGYSEYHPIAPNDTEANKRSNRRVDIMILKSKDLQDSNYIE